MIEVEEWRDIHGFEGLYQASDQGRVRSLDHVDSLGRTRKGRVLKPSEAGHHRNYATVKVGRTMGVHVAVARAFIGPRPSTKHDASHRDNNPANNTPGNIRWLTHRENIAEQKTHGTVCRHGRTGRPQVLDENKVREIRASTEKQIVLAKRFGVSQTLISNIIARRKWPDVV